MKYSYTKQTNLDFDEAVIQTKEKLVEQGFGVLTEIDVQATLKNKIGVDFDKYVILGACNPVFAYKALQAEQEVGLLLPCNVIVYEKNRNVFISSIVPTVAMSMVDGDELPEIAQEVEGSLQTAINNINK